jgi:hypothetical protein
MNKKEIRKYVKSELNKAFNWAKDRYKPVYTIKNILLIDNEVHIDFNYYPLNFFAHDIINISLMRHILTIKAKNINDKLYLKMSIIISEELLKKLMEC